MKQRVAQGIVKENKRVYNSIARQFSQTRQRPWAEFELFKPYVRPGDKLLDIGCGNGRLAPFFGGKDISYTGIDASEKLIELARPQHPEADFIVADAIDIPLPDEQFDVAFLIATLHHIPSDKLRQNVASEAYRLLRPDGRLLMTEWNLWSTQWWPMLIRSAYKKVFKPSGLDWGDMLKPWKDSQGNIKGYRYLHPFTRGELTRLLRSAGFTDITHHITKKGHRAPWYRGYNIVTVAQKR